MAHNLLTVEIEHTRYSPLLDDRTRSPGSVRLTTIEPRQQRAVICVHHERARKRTLVTDFEVIVPRDSQREFPIIRLDGTWTGRRRAHLQLYFEDKLYAERHVRIPGMSRLLLLVPLVVLLVLGGLWLNRPSTPAPRAEAHEQTLRREAPAQAPVPAPQAAPAQRAPAVTAEEPPAAAPAPQAATTPPSPQPSAAPQPSAVAPAPAPAPEPVEHTLTVYFRPDSARLTAVTTAQLNRLVEALPPTPALRTRISGHTAIAGPEAGRRPLSRERAENVSAQLLTMGVEFGPDVQVRGYGSEQPLTHDPDAQDENRRVELLLVFPPAD